MSQQMLNGTATATPQVFTYSPVQNVFKITNTGLSDLHLNINKYENTTIHALGVWENRIEYTEFELFTNEGDTTTFEAVITNDVEDLEQVAIATDANTETIADIENGSPKGVYATVVDLETAYPTGTVGAYVVTADGLWYYWNGSAWTSGGTYQATGIADGTITKENLVDPLQEIMINNGYQILKWNRGKRDGGGTVIDDVYTILSDKFYVNVGDKVLKDLSIDSRYKIYYYGIDGETYDAGKSLTSWQNTDFTAVDEGYFRMHITYSPTSTTVIDGTNGPILEALYLLTSTKIFGIDGDKLKNLSISNEKVLTGITEDKLSLLSRMKKTCDSGFGFGYGVIPSTENEGISKEDYFTFLADMYGLKKSLTPTNSTSYGVLIPNGDVSYLADICVVKDELWCFSTGYDEREGYQNVWRMKYEPETNDLVVLGFFWINIGHANSINYNEITDSIICGNGSASYVLDNEIIILEKVSEIIDLPNGSIVDVSTNGIVIDANALVYDFGVKLNVFWVNEKSVYANYSTATKYLPNTAYAYADDVNKMYTIVLGYGTNQYSLGTYVAPTGDKIWNGTFNVIGVHQIEDPGEVIGGGSGESYDHLGQGGDSIGGVAFLGRGHSSKWWSEISFGYTSADFFRKDVLIPNINQATGAIANVATRGIAVTKNYLIVAFGTNIYFVPR